jgi:hypothetical protein
MSSLLIRDLKVMSPDCLAYSICPLATITGIGDGRDLMLENMEMSGEKW